MDDNMQKSKMPALISFSYCIALFGPALGYYLASISLNTFIEPHLTPIVTTKDSQWLGAWWIGYILIAIVLACFSFLVSLFPKELPRANLRRLLGEEEKRVEEKYANIAFEAEDVFEEVIKEEPFWDSLKRILTNKIYMLNTLASILYFNGLSAYWRFTPKYIETQYRQTAAASR